MDALSNIIPKSIIEVLNRLENDEDNRYLWKLMRNQDSLSFTVTLVRCKLSAKTPNKAKDDSEVAGSATVKPVRRQKKRNSPSVLARSMRRHARFLEKLAGKPDLPLPEDQQDYVCVKELENTSLVCGSDRDLESSDNPKPAPAVEPDLLQGRAVLFDFLAKTNIDSDDSEDNEVDCVCSNCKHPPKEGEELKPCSRCHLTRYCSVQCQRKDWDFHRFACSVVAKKVHSKSLNYLP